MISLKEIKDSFLHIVFPHVCDGCGSDLVNVESRLCIRCIASLPETNFEQHAGNPVEKTFWGRMPVINAAAHFYFTKESLMQRLMHQFKYKGNRDLGLQLGRMMGIALKSCNRFNDINALIPLPLFPSKEKKRGFNQATVLCDGIAEILNLPVLANVITRPQHSETQTKKGRIERWRNIEGKFKLENPQAIQNKHLLLVDDVITTGATLEACGNELLASENVKLSLATLCIASR
ncbi:MAG TPA: phosphoribosyltransferase family protein [Chitinophagaceae bacterium]|nr:phosphoribosyltransferase family protein [Chitinophagaceae bacterium]